MAAIDAQVPRASSGLEPGLALADPGTARA
jgi:hypothetical protein